MLILSCIFKENQILLRKAEYKKNVSFDKNNQQFQLKSPHHLMNNQMKSQHDLINNQMKSHLQIKSGPTLLDQFST